MFCNTYRHQKTTDVDAATQQMYGTALQPHCLGGSLRRPPVPRPTGRPPAQRTRRCSCPHSPCALWPDGAAAAHGDQRPRGCGHPFDIAECNEGWAELEGSLQTTEVWLRCRRPLPGIVPSKRLIVPSLVRRCSMDEKHPLRAVDCGCEQPRQGRILRWDVRILRGGVKVGAPAAVEVLGREAERLLDLWVITESSQDTSRTSRAALRTSSKPHMSVPQPTLCSRRPTTQRLTSSSFTRHFKMACICPVFKGVHNPWTAATLLSPPWLASAGLTIPAATPLIGADIASSPL